MGRQSLVHALVLLAATGAAARGAAVPSSLPEAPFDAEPFAEPACKPVAKEIPLRTLDVVPTWEHFRTLLPSPEAAELLLANRFVVDPGRCYREFFELYEQNRYHPILLDYRTDANDDTIYRKFVQGIPSVVTPDVVLHNLHLFFGHALARAEERRFLPTSRSLVDAMLKETLALAKEAPGAEEKAAARDAAVFLAVARALLDGGTLVTPEEAREIEDTTELTAELERRARAAIDRLLPAELDAEARRLARQELERVLGAKERVRPGILDYPEEQKEDYSQYTVRGHYVKTPALQGYFRGMMWLGRVAFSFQSERALRAAALLTIAAARSPEAFRSWGRIDEACGFLFGVADDPSFRQWLPAFTAAYGATPAVADVGDPAKLARLREALAKVEAPRIQGIVTLQEHGPELADTKAFHFFPQRQVVDAVIFQSLVDPKVPGRSMVTALEVPELLGSVAAAEILAPANLGRSEAYARQHALLAAELPALLEARRGVEAYSAWMDVLRALHPPVAPGRPLFMRSPAYARLRLNAAMASYAELKHDTVLYAKQAAAEMGGPGYEDTEVTIDDRGYVVPEVETYARAERLLALLRRGLAARELFPEEVATAYGRFQELVGSLVAISVKELEGKPLDEKELHLVKFIGGDLEHFWHETLIAGTRGEDEEQFMAFQLLEQNNAQVVADVFTGPSSVLHVATGYVHPVFVIFEREGKLHIGRGGVASYHELEQPARLTDAAWREMLGSTETPVAPPAWTKAYSGPVPAEGADVYFGAEE